MHKSSDARPNCNRELDDVNCDSENSDSRDSPVLFKDKKQNNNAGRNELKVKST